MNVQFIYSSYGNCFFTDKKGVQQEQVFIIFVMKVMFVKMKLITVHFIYIYCAIIKEAQTSCGLKNRLCELEKDLL